MTWLILFVGVVVVCFTAALVLGLVGGGMGRGTTSLSHEPLPDSELAQADLDELRFDVGLRGYRMTQVDGVIDRLRRELREKDEHIVTLRGSGSSSSSGSPWPQPEEPEPSLDPEQPEPVDEPVLTEEPEPTEQTQRSEPHG